MCVSTSQLLEIWRHLRYGTSCTHNCQSFCWLAEASSYMESCHSHRCRCLSLTRPVPVLLRVRV